MAGWPCDGEVRRAMDLPAACWWMTAWLEEVVERGLWNVADELWMEGAWDGRVDEGFLCLTFLRCFHEWTSVGKS